MTRAFGLALLLPLAVVVSCGRDPARPVGELAAIAGQVTHESAERTSTLSAISREPLFPRDGITVSAAGEAAILSGPTVQRLGPNTRLRVPGSSSRFVEAVELISGLATFLVEPGENRRFAVHAKGAVLTVKGTLFRVDATGADLKLDVLSGTVVVEAAGKSTEVGRETRATISGESVKLSPLDASEAKALEFDFMTFRVKTGSANPNTSSF